MIDFFTLPDPQIAQLTKPALCSFSNAEADWNQLSKLWSWSHFKEYWIIPDFDLFGSPSDNRMKKGFQDTQKRPILLLQGSNETRHATKSIAVLGISEGEMAELPVNTFKAAIYAGEVQLGIWSNIRDPLVVEALGDSGFDFVTIDCEHAPNDLGDVVTALQVLRGTPAQAAVRVPSLDPAALKRVLDAGAQTVIVPYIQTVEEAELAAAAVAYPPHGFRGVAGGVRAAGFGAIEDYYTKARDEICLVLQIETQQGLDNLEAIAAVDGVDALFVGPSDLSASLGYPQQMTEEPMQNAIRDGIERIAATGKPAGFLATSDLLLQIAKDAGAKMIVPAIDMTSLRLAVGDNLAAHSHLKN